MFCPAAAAAGAIRFRATRSLGQPTARKAWSDMTQPALTLTDQPTDSDEKVIASGLADYNAMKAGYRDWRPLAALLRDPDTGETLGGMIGRTSYGLLFVDLVYLPETLRGQDIGRRLMAMMEQEG